MKSAFYVIDYRFNLQENIKYDKKIKVLSVKSHFSQDYISEGHEYDECMV